MMLELFPECPEDAASIVSTIKTGLARGREKLSMLNFPKGGRLVEITPGKFAAEVELEDNMLTGLLRLRMMENGMFRPYVSIMPDRMSPEEISQYMPVSARVLKQLLDAGFITGTYMMPGKMHISLPSLFAHIRNCTIKPGQPGFWTPERLKRYKDAQTKVPTKDLWNE